MKEEYSFLLKHEIEQFSKYSVAFNCQFTLIFKENNIFIALIHPIQWTIALPVGVTGPAKRQKKTSCI